MFIRAVNRLLSRHEQPPPEDEPTPRPSRLARFAAWLRGRKPGEEPESPESIMQRSTLHRPGVSEYARRLADRYGAL